MKKSAINFLLLFTTVLFCLLLTELGLRIFHPQNLTLSYQTRDGLRILRPNHSGIARSADTVEHYQINALGMRDREHQLEKPKGTYRILILGDSFMEALQVSFERSFPSILERRLNQISRRPIEVINAAVSGWGTDDEFTYLRRYGSKLKPDLILIAMTMTNDVSDNLAEKFHTLVNNELVEKPVHQFSLVEYRLWQVKAFLGSHSHLYQLSRLWWHFKEMEVGAQQLSAHVTDQFRKEPNERIIRGWRLTFELLKGIKTCGKEIGAETMIFLIPISIQLDDEKLARFYVDHQLTKDSIRLERPQELMKEFGKAEAIEVFDLLPGFKEFHSQNRSPLVLKHDGHWTEAGHTVAADIVIKELIQRLLLEQTATVNGRISQASAR